MAVLSVIASQILQIQNAIKSKVLTFNFEEDHIQLIPTCCINITMNPDYQGRS